MKNIQKYNKPVLRVIDAYEHPDPEDPGGTKDCFKELDALIARGEQAEQQEKTYKEQELEKEFRKRLYTELKKKGIRDMTWREVELWSDLQHDESRFYTPDVQKRYAAIHKAAETDDGNYQACLMMIRTSLEILPELQSQFPQEISKLSSLFQKLAEKIQEEIETEEKEPEREPEEIRDTTPVEVTKSMGIQIHKGNIVSGWSSIESVDSSGDVLPLEELQKNLQDFYMSGGRICLNHDENNIIGQLRSYEFRKNAQGKPGLYVNVALHDNISKDIINDISNGRLKGFSWSFRANREKTCQKDKCYNSLEMIPNAISELSIVSYPCNAGALIESIHEAS